MCKRLMFATLHVVSIVFRKESFTNAKKVSNFIQGLKNEKKVIKYGQLSLIRIHIIQTFTNSSKIPRSPQNFL